MARDGGKRAQNVPGPRREESGRHAKVSASRPRAHAAGDAPDTQGDAPASHRAPGRGKYDRTRSPDEREREQLHRLLEAAGHVFAEMGWADATVEAIVNRAGMSRRTFYEQFDDLKECLMVLHSKVTRIAFRGVEASARAQSSPREMLASAVRSFLGSIATFPHMARVVFRVVRAAGPEFEAVHEQMMARFGKLFLDGLQASFAEGGLGKRPADGQVELRAFALVSGMEAVAMRYVLRGEESKALEAAPILIDMVQKTFAP